MKCSRCGRTSTALIMIGQRVYKSESGKAVNQPVYACQRDRRCQSKLAEQARAAAYN